MVNFFKTEHQENDDIVTSLVDDTGKVWLTVTKKARCC